MSDINMKQIYDAWRQAGVFTSGEPISPKDAEAKALEFFTAEGLAGSWLRKAVRQVVELAAQGADIDQAIRSVDETLWNL